LVLCPRRNGLLGHFGARSNDQACFRCPTFRTIPGTLCKTDHCRMYGICISLLATLPEVPSASHEEARALVDLRKLCGTGLGWVDVHLLASALLAGVPLWTLDRRLASVAGRLKIGIQR
jgi:hypothetical protein